MPPELLHHAGADDLHTRLTVGGARAITDAVRQRWAGGCLAGRRVVRIGWTCDDEPVQSQRDVRRPELDALSRRHGARHVADELTIFDDDFRHGDGSADVLGRRRRRVRRNNQRNEREASEAHTSHDVLLEHYD